MKAPRVFTRGSTATSRIWLLGLIAVLFRVSPLNAASQSQARLRGDLALVRKHGLDRTARSYERVLRHAFTDRDRGSALSSVKMGRRFTPTLDRMLSELSKLQSELLAGGHTREADLAATLAGRITTIRRQGSPYRAALEAGMHFSEFVMLCHHLAGRIPRGVSYEEDLERTSRSIEGNLPSTDLIRIVEKETGVAFPTFQNIGIRDITVMRLFRVYPLGLTVRPITRVDATDMDPSSFWSHDGGHTTTFVGVDSPAAVERHLAQTADIRTFLKTVFRQADSIDPVRDPYLKKAIDLCLFQYFHEMGRSWDDFKKMGLRELSTGTQERRVFVKWLASGHFGAVDPLGPQPEKELDRAERLIAQVAKKVNGP